jgi:hypothetical protein
MGLSNNGKLFVLILLVGVVVYFLSTNCNSEPMHNDGILSQDQTVPSLNVTSDNDMRHSDMNESVDLDSADNMLSSLPNGLGPMSTSDREKLKRKMLSRNSAKNGEYKHVSFADGDRSSQSASLDKFFEGNHPQDIGQNAGFTPSTDGDAQYAAYVSGKGNKKLTDKEKFNASNLLPKEKSGEWFDDPYEATSVKASNLINIFRPIGVNTVQTTKKNPTLDIRGTIPNPKYAVAPWMNSSIEPDTNIRFGSFC